MVNQWGGMVDPAAHDRMSEQRHRTSAPSSV
eukprot:CAMPEP_0119377846 /NCGR_PEP_ID=MMETSP1334-20130426/46927_1 /TAXON_ID=127549 /ORGANISM="Calcidiscus leptoporus, Strain RCC1130" /LENGTH=30 /DNA_ID= /DNA_START= /DNA_END= /DNA_ORIENTATION=